MAEKSLGFRRDRFKELLEKHDPPLNQRELADKIGARPKDVSNWVTGKHKPTYEHLKAIAETLDATTDYLLGVVDNPKQVSPLRTHPELLDRLWEAIQRKEFVEANELFTRLLKGEE